MDYLVLRYMLLLLPRCVLMIGARRRIRVEEIPANAVVFRARSPTQPNPAAMATLSSRPIAFHAFSPLPFRLPSSASPRPLHPSLPFRLPPSPPAFASSSSFTPTATSKASPPFADVDNTLDDPLQHADSNELLQQKQLFAAALALGLMLGSAEAAIAFGGPEGPLVEEFWDNMRRYALYFLTVATGGIYSILQPVFSLLRNPLTAVFTVAIITGSIYLLYLTLNTMLGISAFDYKYAT